jgi:hypothetical protein
MIGTADWAQLTALVHRYACLVDQRELDAAAALFTEDGELVLPAPPRSLAPTRAYRGRAEILRSLSAVNDTVATMHGILGVVVDLDGDDRASGAVTGVAHHLLARPGGVIDLVWYLRYRDVYRHGDRWRIARRELWIDWTETRPVGQARETAPTEDHDG